MAEDRQAFVSSTDAEIVVLDIPLLFETNSETSVDYVVVVSAPEADQAQRVLARPGMTKERFELILSKQMPDADKRKRADFIVPTTSLEAAREAVHNIVRKIKQANNDARNRPRH